MSEVPKGTFRDCKQSLRSGVARTLVYCRHKKETSMILLFLIEWKQCDRWMSLLKCYFLSFLFFQYFLSSKQTSTHIIIKSPIKKNRKILSILLSSKENIIRDISDMNRAISCFFSFFISFLIINCTLLFLLRNWYYSIPI